MAAAAGAEVLLAVSFSRRLAPSDETLVAVSQREYTHCDVAPAIVFYLMLRWTAHWSIRSSDSSLLRQHEGA